MGRKLNALSTEPKNISVNHLINQFSQYRKFRCDLDDFDLEKLFIAIEKDRRKDLKYYSIFQKISKNHLLFKKRIFRENPPYYGELAYKSNQLTLSVGYETSTVVIRIMMPFLAVLIVYCVSDFSWYFGLFLFVVSLMVGIFFLRFYIKTEIEILENKIIKELNHRKIKFLKNK